MEMINKKRDYSRPVIQVIELDSSITLVMMTVSNPDPRGDTNKTPSSDPFSSPFDSKPFG